MDLFLGIIAVVALGLLALTLCVGMVYATLIGLQGILEAWEDLRDMFECWRVEDGK